MSNGNGRPESGVIELKWNGKMEEVSLEGLDTIRDLKARLFTLLDVQVHNQRLLGLKGKKGPVTDDTAIADLNLRPPVKAMLSGQPDYVLEREKAIADEVAGAGPSTVDSDEEERTDVSNAHMEVFKAKVAKRVASYEIKVKNPLREGKKLLVLDIDYTLYDHRSTAETIQILMRPHLHDFLASVYPFYDIVIWSATSMKWIDAKLAEMGLTESAEFKIAFCLDAYAMISIYTEELGSCEVRIRLAEMGLTESAEFKIAFCLELDAYAMISIYTEELGSCEVRIRLAEMGLTESAEFKLAFCLDAYAMISIYTEELGSCEVRIRLAEMGLTESAEFKLAFCLDAYAMISIYTEELGSCEVMVLLAEMRLTESAEFKIAFCLDAYAMISIYTEELGSCEVRIQLAEMGLTESAEFKLAFCLDAYAMISIYTEELGSCEVATFFQLLSLHVKQYRAQGRTKSRGN